jgi:hypothetical protein
VTHVGEYPLPESTQEEREAMFGRYAAMPNPLARRQ